MSLLKSLSALGRWMRRKAHVWLPVAVLAALALAARDGHEPTALVEIREALFDTYQRLRPREFRPAPVRIVDIDDESLQRVGQWPWPRDRLAEITRRLHAQGAAAVVYDVLLAEPDQTSPRRVMQPWRDIPGVEERLRFLPDNDETLAAAVRAARVVTGFALSIHPGSTVPATKAGFAFVGDGAHPRLPAAGGAIVTLPILEAGAEGNGALSVSLSAGGVIRHLPLLWSIGQQPYPSLSAEALRVAQATETYLVRLDEDGTVGGVRVGAFEIPTDASGRLWLYMTVPRGDRYIPAWRVLDGAPADVEGAIVFVGPSARGLEDIHKTPLGDDVPGVEFHAQAIEQILHETYLVRPWWAKAAEIGLLLALGAAVLVLGARAGPTATAFLAAGIAAGAFAASWFAFAEARLLLDPIVPAVSVVAVYFSHSLLRHLQTERQQRWIRKAFASYLSPKLVNELVDDPSQLQLRGERRELTFVFTDLEDFTRFVEQTPPSIVVPVLNEYLDGMIRVAFHFDGTVDKIIGDAVHIMFGAPIVDPQHAERAVACALALDRFACKFQEMKRAEGVALGQTRIGVNSGSAIVGNFGGDLRFDYTAHGDAINTAARLESVNKVLGTRICVSDHTVRMCPAFSGRPAGTLLLKGKSEAIRVWEPVATDTRDEPALAAYLEAFRRMEANDPAAEAAFADLVRDRPHDRLAAFHLQRLRNRATGDLVVLTEK